MYWKNVGASLIAILVISFASSVFASDVKGMISSRTGETLIVKTGQGNVTVVLTDDTKTKDNTGLFGLGTDPLSQSVLIPGLKVNVDGEANGEGRVTAHTITVDGDDLETAEMIQAGLNPTAEQVEENIQSIAANKQNIEAHGVQLAAHRENIETNQQNISANKRDIEENTERFMALSDYDLKGQATVKFKFGSSEVSSEDQERLKGLAQSATGLTGYIVEVTGYADSTGGAAMNTRLSEDRAKAVVRYLFQECKVPMRHIVAPGAMGEYGPAAPNETKEGRAENRRVDVKILVNKGVTGS